MKKLKIITVLFIVVIVGYAIYGSVGHEVLGIEWIQANNGQNAAAVWKFRNTDMATQYFQTHNIQQNYLLTGSISDVDSIYSKLETPSSDVDFKVLRESNLLGLLDNFSMIGEDFDSKFNTWISKNNLEKVRL